nr:DUF2336 domain-containing protein [Bradyrhizobium sp. dw_411]
MELFDEVLDRLLDEIDVTARAAFGDRLATFPDASQNIVRRPAPDDPVSPAISLRRTPVGPVTDTLDERGNNDIILNSAGDYGAALSEFGCSTAVQRPTGNDEFTVLSWMRPEIPRQQFLKLLAEASESVKLQLTIKEPCKAALVAETVAAASSRIQARTRETSARHAMAHFRVRTLYETGELGESMLAEFANNMQFDEAVIALSHISDLPISLVERAFGNERSDQIIVLARAEEMSWDTTKAILMLQNRKRNSVQKHDISFETFIRLRVETAKKAVSFYRLRARAMIQRSK